MTRWSSTYMVLSDEILGAHSEYPTLLPRNLGARERATIVHDLRRIEHEQEQE